MVTFRKRVELEKARQRRRNMRDAIKTLGYIVCLIMWAMVLMGVADFCAGGW